MNWPRADLPLRGLIPLLLLDVNNGWVDSRDLLILHMGQRQCKHRQSKGDTNRMHQGAIYACGVVHPNGPMGMYLSSSNILCGNIMGVDICDLNLLDYLILTISSVRRNSIFSAGSEAVASLAVPPEAGGAWCDSLRFHAEGWIALLHVQGIHGDWLDTVSHG
jgi:hypothetical protein